MAAPWVCGCRSIFYEKILEALRSHPARVHDPAAADLLFPALDTAGETNYPIYGRQQDNMIAGDFLECHASERRKVIQVRHSVQNELRYLGDAHVHGIHVIFDFDPTDNSLVEFARGRLDVLIAKNSACNTSRAVGRQHGMQIWQAVGNRACECGNSERLTCCVSCESAV